MPNQTRQLAAIMFTDIVGFTALMGKDSAKALDMVRVSKEIQKPLVEKHHGKWLKEMGDGAMAQFSSALDAVNCALEIQKLAKDGLDAKLRIGIHLGDITIQNNDIYGDGVNVASRLESISDPGGIYVSESIEKAIRGQSKIQVKFLGEILLKNVDYGVRTYALQGEGLPLPKVKLDKKISGGFFTQLIQRAKSPAGIVIILLSIVVLTVSGNILYNAFWNTSGNNSVNIDKSIAVMPFDNRSHFEEDESFTDGIHDDLLTQISKIRDIKTISRTSVMGYRNTTKNMRVIGEELGAAIILEGGVQRAGNQIRINVQLIDAKADAHLWAETYTRELNVENILAIQSEIALAIAASLKIILSPEEQQDIEKLPTQNLAALEAYFHAKTSIDKNTNEGFQEAIDNLSLAIELDPTFAIAYAILGQLTLDKFWWAGLNIEEQIAKGKPLIEKAMQLDSNISEVQMAYGYLKGYEKDVKDYKLNAQKAEGLHLNNAEAYAAYKDDLKDQEFAYQKAIELNSNNAKAYAAYGQLLKGLGKEDQGMAFLFKARELNPIDDQLGMQLSWSLIATGRFDEARQIVEGIISRKPDYSQAYMGLASIFFNGDHQLAESLRMLHKVNTLNPGKPYQSILIGNAYDHLGNKALASEWFNHALILSPDVGGAVLAKGFIHEFNGEYNKAFKNYLEPTRGGIWVFQLEMLRLMEVGLKTNRSAEVMEHYQKAMPALFQTDVLIDNNNFILALALGRLLKAKGEDEQADHILRGSLKIAQEEKFEGVGVKINNWECRIHLALGENEAALASFIKLVSKGIYSDRIVRDPVYKPLYRFPEFQRNMDIMKARLAEEQAKVDEMLAEGALNILPLQ